MNVLFTENSDWVYLGKEPGTWIQLLGGAILFTTEIGSNTLIISYAASFDDLHAVRL